MKDPFNLMKYKIGDTVYAHQLFESKIFKGKVVNRKNLGPVKMYKLLVETDNYDWYGNFVFWTTEGSIIPPEIK